MLYDYVLEQCNNRYNIHRKNNMGNESCRTCSYGSFCPKDCEKCLMYIHFPQNAPLPRNYDCVHMSEFYTCKYANKSASEMVHALSAVNILTWKRNIKVLSIGCGPCTDLYALDYWLDTYRLDKKKLKIYYWGLDLNHIWYLIHSDIKAYYKFYNLGEWNLNFSQMDVCKDFENFPRYHWTPDIIILQYFLSDLVKHSGKDKATQFIHKLASYFNNFMLPNSYIIINDINLTVEMLGGREYFDILESEMQNCKVIRKGYFQRPNKKDFVYGDLYESNGILFPIKFNFYSPFDYCASAQLVIEKRK